ncbi:type II secretion system major pseudopilin GspG [Duganella sp. CY15W]|uniref:type II secretion system major pseudopilin GspG n=1 Tax=Duganella sp. CY15W TaxID=2692172 RepID=UPI00136C8445|nr:type II secretion system major pseudopilin GspG [Duganella sp. CY15W]MYM27955.1 type II secretion system major pseudopilin GspG [Duganella sp. CY15W]
MRQIKVAGFSLLELLVVIAILGMLATFAGPRYFAQLERSKAQIVRTQIEAMDKGVVQYRIDTGHYPPAAPGLVALFAPPPHEANWQGPYLHKYLPTDAWEHPYVYLLPGRDDREYEIISYGSDGQPGGQGDAADITNWQ